MPNRLTSAAVIAVVMLAVPAAAQTFGGPLGPLPIPDGVGSCLPGTPLVVSLTVPPGTGPVPYLTLDVGLTQTW